MGLEYETAGDPGPNIVAPPPLVYGLPWLIGLILDRAAPLPRIPSTLRWLGLPLAAAGVALGGWFVMTMQAARTPIDPREAPRALVVQGPFQYSRNPAYLGLALTYVGASLLAGARWPLIFLPGVVATMDRGVIQREERYLQNRFGSRYREYGRRVRRWF